MITRQQIEQYTDIQREIIMLSDQIYDAENGGDPEEDGTETWRARCPPAGGPRAVSFAVHRDETGDRRHYDGRTGLVAGRAASTRKLHRSVLRVAGCCGNDRVVLERSEA